MKLSKKLRQFGVDNGYLFEYEQDGVQITAPTRYASFDDALADAILAGTDQLAGRQLHARYMRKRAGYAAAFRRAQRGSGRK